MDNPIIQVFIVTYNRPDTLLRAIDSVLNQTYPNVELIVSDNSTNDDTYDVLKSSSSWGRYNYIRRRPSINPGLEHMKTVFDEATAEYFIVFHDDDEMFPEMVDELYKAISEDDIYSAAGGNAYAVSGKNKKLYFHSKRFILNSGEELIKRYHRRESAAPFPGYMYRRRKIMDIHLDYYHKGGKYGDVAFLFDAAQKGPMIFVGKPLMIYNIHPGQESANFDFLRHIQLTNYLLRNVQEKKSIKYFRLYAVYRNAIMGWTCSEIKYNRMVARLLMYNSFVLYIKYLIRLIQSKR